MKREITWRDLIEKIDRHYVEHFCNFNERMMRNLEIIKEHKIVKREHLIVLNECYRKMKSRKYADKISKIDLKTMFNLYALNKAIYSNDPKNKYCLYYSIGKAGSIKLGVKYIERLKEILFTNNNGVAYIKYATPFNIKHIDGINNLKVETILFCDKYNAHIDFWHIEKRWNVGQKGFLIPDIYTKITLEQYELPAFIEYDRNTENRREKEPKTILQKVAKYKTLSLTTNWKTKEVYYFPYVIFITNRSESVKERIRKELKIKGLRGFVFSEEEYVSFLEYSFYIKD